MTPAEKMKIEGWLTVLREVVKDYHGKTIDNIIQQLTAVAEEYKPNKQQANESNRIENRRLF